MVLDDADFEKLPLKSLKQIEILGFVEDSIDPRIIEDCYYLAPEKGKKRGITADERAFQLILKTMEKLGVKAVAKLVMREKEHLCLVQPFDSILLLQTLCYADEVRDYEELKPTAVAIGEKELELAEMLIKQRTMVFEHGVFENDYRKALEQLIEAKIAGKEVVSIAEAPVPVGDLVSQLLASIGMK